MTVTVLLTAHLGVTRARLLDRRSSNSRGGQCRISSNDAAPAGRRIDRRDYRSVRPHGNEEASPLPAPNMI
jgi:hypothetical protein